MLPLAADAFGFDRIQNGVPAAFTRDSRSLLLVPTAGEVAAESTIDLHK